MMRRIYMLTVYLEVILSTRGGESCSSEIEPDKHSKLKGLGINNFAKSVFVHTLAGFQPSSEPAPFFFSSIPKSSAIAAEICRLAGSQQESHCQYVGDNRTP